MFDAYDLLALLFSLIAVVVVLTVHEYAHAFVAVKCGDQTPKVNGRLTLNPLKHFDIFGLIMFALCGFGWAKPVPINPYNFKHYRSGLAMTALAGVVTNLICAILFYPMYRLVYLYMSNTVWRTMLMYLFYYLYIYSLTFCVFNLIPLPPLDGWRVVDALKRKRGKVFYWIERYGRIVLMVLILIHFVVNLLTNYISAVSFLQYFDLLGLFLNYIVYYIGYPITWLWGLIIV